MIDVMKALGDRFWIPHQVLEEFWRNRERALVSPLAEIQQSTHELEKQFNSAREIIQVWVNRAALDQGAADAVKNQLAESFSAAQRLIEGLIEDADQVAKARNTSHDIVLKLLEPVLEGHVGPPMKDSDHAAAVTEGKRRAAAGEVPGFADVKKAESSPEGAAGDYLVWEQVLSEAARRKLDIVFVTGDVKKDWWRYEGSFPRGPRIELVRELRRRCQTMLYMMRPDMLLTYADALAVTVEKQSVENVERTIRTQASPLDDPAATALVTRAAEGDQDAWHELVDRYTPLVYTVCTRYGLSGQDIEEVGQSVWLLLVEQLSELREPGMLPGWLARTTKRECLRVVTAAPKSDRLDTMLDDASLFANDAMVDQAILTAERRSALRAAFAELPPRCRQLMSMLMSDPPHSYTEISAKLGIPVGSIGPQRARCLERLRRSMALPLSLREMASSTSGEIKEIHDE